MIYKTQLSYTTGQLRSDVMYRPHPFMHSTKKASKKILTNCGIRCFCKLWYISCLQNRILHHRACPRTWFAAVPIKPRFVGGIRIQQHLVTLRLYFVQLMSQHGPHLLSSLLNHGISPWVNSRPKNKETSLQFLRPFIYPRTSVMSNAWLPSNFSNTWY